MENHLSETVLITGGNGLIGRYLSVRLKSLGYKVNIIGRLANKNSEFQQFTWDLNQDKIESEALSKADYIIHLAGANIGESRWTKKRKQEIIDSREKSTQLLFKKFKEDRHKLKAFISASAVGYYGMVTSEKIFTENDLPGNDFLGITCRSWEKSVDRFEEIGIRTVKIRTGLVLTKNSGALEKIIIPVKIGIGSALGNGDQFMPWIHIDDLCNIYIKAIEDTKMHGAYNAVAPEHITNKEFMQALCKAFKKPFRSLNVPAFALRLLLGEMSGIVLNGSRVSSDKLREAGYNFLFSKLQYTFKSLFSEEYNS